MTGPRRRFRYVLTASDGNTSRRCYSRVDEDASTLVLDGLRNTEPTAVAASNTYDFDIPAGGPSQKTNISARRVRVDYTGALPSQRTNPVVWVVIFRQTTWDSYAVGQTGTHRDVPVVCVAKIEGSPA